MTPDSFATRSLSPRDQHEAWRAWFLPVLEVMPGSPAGDGFPAENHIWKLDGLAVSRVSAPAVRVARSRALLRRTPVDHWVLTYCTHGTTTIRTERGELRAPPSMPFLWSLGEPSESERTAVDRVQIFLSRDRFRDVAPLLDAARLSVLDTPLGHLLGDYMLSLERRLPTLSTSDAPRMTAAIGAMVAACVAPSVERQTIARGQIELGRLERLRQAVRTHLRSPSLGPNMLCRLVGISRSNLYRLLEDAGGVSRYIQRQRLLDAHALLSNPAGTRPIALIAHDLCFADASSFGRAFRKEFGYSPGEVRAAALTGLTPPALPRRRTGTDPERFGDLLSGF